MVEYILSRLARTLLVILGLTLVVFIVVQASGDPARIMLPPFASAQEEAALREALGLNRPWHVQYLTFLSHTLRGDFGRSIRYGQPALQLVFEALPATLQLALTALVLSVIIGIPLGIVGAIREQSPDRKSVV